MVYALFFALFSKPWWKTVPKPVEENTQKGSASGSSPDNSRESEGAETESVEREAAPSRGGASRSAPRSAQREPREDNRPRSRSRRAAPVAAQSREDLPEVDEDLDDPDSVEGDSGDADGPLDSDVDSDSDSAGDYQFQHEDPLAPALDLDYAEPVQRRRRGRGGDDETPWRTKIDSAKEFFGTEILYRFDILESDNRTAMAGSYRLELKGYKGGVWTLIVGEDLTILNKREEADQVITMQQADFLHIINGDLNPQLAILAQKVRTTGDVRKIVAFQSLLAPDLG